MDTVARGRIAFWEGGSLWVFDVPTGADAPDRIAMHSHHAFQLTFSLGGDFNLHLEDRVVGGPFAIVAPDAPHAFDAQGLISLLFIEPESRAGRVLAQLLQGKPASQLSDEQVRDAPALFKAAFEHPTDPIKELVAAGSEVAARIAAHVRTTEPDLARAPDHQMGHRESGWSGGNE